MKKIIIFIALLFVSFGLIACNQNSIQTITFETNQGTPIESIEFRNSYDITNLSQLSTSKNGYTFDGWFTNVSLDSSFAVTEDIKESITLYAKWNIVNYTITYYLDEGINASNNPTTFTILDNIPLEAATKTGYSFGGWYSDDSFTQEVTSIEAGTNANIDLYAKWDNLNYTITYHLDEGVNASNNPNTFTILDNITLESASKTGYSFGGWYSDDSFTQKVTSIEAGTNANIDLYAKWVNLNYTITYHLDEGVNASNNPTAFTILDNITLEAATKTGYSFGGWYSDDSFTQEVTSIEVGTNSNINLYAKWNIVNYTITWKNDDGSILKTDEVAEGSIPDYSLGTPTKAETDTHTFTFAGWSPEIVIATENKTYTAIFTMKEKDIEINFDPTELNEIIGFDIYTLIPEIISNDYLLTNVSDEFFIEVFIDIFDMTSEEAFAYMDQLDLMFTYDDTEQSWVIGDYFLYVYEDTETYPGDTIYGISIYKELSATEPVEGLYYSFNVQDTTSTLDSSYKNVLNQTILFPGSENLVTVKVSHLATITTPPTGLSQGYIFAANVKGISNPTTYLEIDTLGQVIKSMNFEIEARDNFSSKLTDAKIQVLNGSTWEDLLGGNFYSKLSTNMEVITISNLNVSKFRILFVGNGETSNGGQVKVSNIELYAGSSETTVESWSDMIQTLSGYLNESSLASLLPEVSDINKLSLVKVNNKEYSIKGEFPDSNNDDRIDNYILSLLLNGYILNTELSVNRDQSVYSLEINDDSAIALYITYTNTELEIQIWKYDPVIEQITLDTLSPRETINEYEVSEFGISGLPSTGTYNVLVIPVEINGSPFPVNYLNNLDLVFNGSSIETGWESVSSFYTKSSYGALNLQFDIAQKYSTMNNKSYYEKIGEDADQYLMVEALNGLNSQIDFSQYDSNNDGTIDAVLFIYSVDYSDLDPWWAWVYTAQEGEASSLGKLDGKTFDYYLWASYDFLNDEIPGINGLVVNSETYIHELGHLMGLPDLYSYTEDIQFGPVGGFDMMDYNSGDHGPFNKLVLGWLQPLVAVAGSYQITLDAYSTDTDGLNNALLIPYNIDDLNDGDAFDEYLLVMFYTPDGLYDGHINTPYVLDDAGVYIYHIDARMNSNNTYWGEYFMYNNDGDEDFIVELLEADFNNSLPTSSSNGIKQSDILSSGSIDLSRYSWHQGGKINVIIEIAFAFDNNSTQAVLNLNVLQ